MAIAKPWPPGESGHTDVCHDHVGAVAEVFEFDDDRRLHMYAWWQTHLLGGHRIAVGVLRGLLRPCGVDRRGGWP